MAEMHRAEGPVHYASEQPDSPRVKCRWCDWSIALYNNAGKDTGYSHLKEHVRQKHYHESRRRG